MAKEVGGGVGFTVAVAVPINGYFLLISAQWGNIAVQIYAHQHFLLLSSK